MRTPLEFAAFCLVVIAIHRLWHFEVIFSGVQRYIGVLQARLGRNGALLYPVACPSCSPIWFAATVALVWPYIPSWLVLTLAAYPVIRFVTAAATSATQLSAALYHRLMKPVP